MSGVRGSQPVSWAPTTTETIKTYGCKATFLPCLLFCVWSALCMASQTFAIGLGTSYNSAFEKDENLDCQRDLLVLCFFRTPWTTSWVKRKDYAELCSISAAICLFGTWNLIDFPLHHTGGAQRWPASSLPSGTTRLHPSDLSISPQ